MSVRSDHRTADSTVRDYCLIVDARTPLEIQAEAHRLGLIPWLPDSGEPS